MRKERVSRGIGAALVVLLALASWGCGDDVTLENACPRINHAEAVGYVPGRLVVAVWLQDLEEDPVDLEVTLGSEGAPLTVLGHGPVGLTTDAEGPGRPHELLIPDTAVTAGDVIRLVPTDFEGCTGEEAVVAVPAPAAEEE